MVGLRPLDVRYISTLIKLPTQKINTSNKIRGIRVYTREIINNSLYTISNTHSSNSDVRTKR